MKTATPMATPVGEDLGSPPLPLLCEAAKTNEFAHVSAESSRQRIRQMQDEDSRQHYLFLYAACADCVQCVSAWLARGADV